MMDGLKLFLPQRELEQLACWLKRPPLTTPAEHVGRVYALISIHLIQTKTLETRSRVCVQVIVCVRVRVSQCVVCVVCVCVL